MLLNLMVVSLVPLLIAGYVTQRIVLNIILDNEREDIQVHAAELKLAIDQTQAKRLSEAESFARIASLVSFAKEPSPAGAEPVLSNFKMILSSNANIRSLFLIDPASGSVILSTAEDQKDMRYGNRAFVKEAASGRSSFSTPSRDRGQNLVYFSAPVKTDENGRVLAVLVMAVSADDIWSYVRGAIGQIGVGSLAVLTDEYGVRIAHSTDESLVYKSWAPLPEETRQAIIREQRYGADITDIGSTDFQDITTAVTATDPPKYIFAHKLAVSGETYESGISRSQLTRWTVLESVPHSAFLSPVSDIRASMAIIMGLAAIAMIALVSISSRAASTPVRRLSRSVAKMSEGDMNSPIPEIPDREMSILAKQFEDMRQKVSNSYDMLEEAYLDIARALTASLEARDPHTAGHTERVGQYALALARRLGLSEVEISDVKKAADLHDIGKIAVPDAILLKPNKLTPGEYAEIKRHPSKSAEIIHYLGFLRNALPGIEGHHENYDGTGYPRGLKGKEIPLMARILGLADAYDAMTSSRAYRRAMSHERATEILRDGAGTQWDPKLVLIFLDMLGEGKISEEQPVVPKPGEPVISK
jgi:HD-GYP domain-containing protein (c-di-GMP phosphodiesterase class II)